MSLASFKHTLQNCISSDDQEWNYTIPNLPKPHRLDQDRFIKTVSLFLTKGKHEIVLSLVKAQDNRAIRSKPLHRFLIVSLSEFQPPPRPSSTSPTASPANKLQPCTARECIDYAIRFLRTGITLQGEHYNFYGHSNSQLKSRTCFLYAAPKEVISNMIESLGDFSKMKTVGKKAKRIGLLFSTAKVAMQVSPDCVEDIPDVEADDYTFTDGCGLIAPRLAQELARRTRIIYRDRRYTPSAFQIRYRGYKGMVTVDPTMSKGKVLLKMRKSMKKFNGGDDHSFSIIDYSRPYAYGYLNDEVIVLLSALGISREVLHRKQAEHFGFLAEATGDPGAAFRFLSYLNQPELAEKILMEDNLQQIQSRVAALVRSEYGKMLNKRDEQKCRILLPQSRLIFGVCDPYGVLKEGECAVKVTLFGDGQPAALKGMEVLVTRNPCLHPGDLQKFKLVEKPELAHLIDCVVFSTKGKRPAADRMSGGDLDGDPFFVCWDQDIIPTTISDPAHYPGAKEPLSFKPISDDDRLVYLVKYTNASLGKVKNLYLKWAHLRGPMAPECQELNRLFSQSVDGNLIRVPPKLEAVPPLPDDAPEFVLDDLHRAAKALIDQNTTHARQNSLDGYDFDAIELLLSRDEVAMSEFEFICMTHRWCRKHGQAFETFLGYFDFNALTAEEKAWVLQQIPSSAQSPDLVMNAVSHSNLITEEEARRFQLNHHSIHWKRIYDSTSRDRMATLLETASKAMDLFHKKLIILHVDERLTVAIYIPKKIEPSADFLVDDSVRLFSFPHTQGTERQSRMVVPTKMKYQLYCDNNTLQLFQGTRANTWIFIGRGASDDSLYRSVEGAGHRRRARQATIDSGINSDFVVSIALQNFSQGLRQHIGRVNRVGIQAAEIYIISNRDVKSIATLDLWLQHVDTDTVLPLFDQEVEEYSIPTIHDVDWDSEPIFIVDFVRQGNLALLNKLERAGQLSQIFLWLLERDGTALLLKAFDYLLSGIIGGDLNQLTKVPSPDSLRSMLSFLQRAPFLAISFGRMQFLESAYEASETLANMLEAYSFEVLRAYILSANDTKELVVTPLKSYLSRVRGLTMWQFGELVQLVALTVRQPEVAMDILLECFEAESARLLSGRPALVQHFVRNVIAIALDHIGEASEQSKTRKELLRLKLLPELKDGYQVVEITFRIDSENGRLENAAHVRLTAASPPANSMLGKRYSVDALVDYAEQGLARFKCFHPLPSFWEQCQWKLTHCGPFTTTQTMFDAVREFATDPDCCLITDKLLGLDAPGPVDTNNYHFQRVEKLNSSQNTAVEAAIRSSLTCLWGPPGTGKTETIVQVILALQGALPDSRILVTAPTHNAVDNVLRRYISASPRIGPLRVSTEARKVAEDLRKFTLDAMAGVDLNAERNRKAINEAKKRVKKSQIVFTTGIGSGLGLLRGQCFDVVIVDEASQQTEPVSLVPLVKGCQKAILVGDHVQLRPTVQQASQSVEFDRSLFERLFTSDSKGVKRTMLDTQYRMHDSICSFSSKEFYEGKLLTGIPPSSRPLSPSKFPWPRSDSKRMVFVECAASEEFGKSKTNVGQAEICVAICKLLNTNLVDTTTQTIAVLTPYAKQVELLSKKLSGISTVEVSSIDGFQGREADIVVFVTVRCNLDRQLGFMDDFRRMNVAMTRAKAGVIVIGNKETLVNSQDEEGAGLWRRLIQGLAVVEVGW
ncbi:RNA dependent RNA polymerase-domain-containing protein [Podospora australis]|uniref:RNA dependent RNA polymerase-domain-containing protein n=1 Tax=Podospora australis TaxID=1536484 RepID=A0AAN7ACL6_9PEZI|nr:RNA dependent RNA polymerase-domain-containing protein [Podospora australis]